MTKGAYNQFAEDIIFKMGTVELAPAFDAIRATPTGSRAARFDYNMLHTAEDVLFLFGFHPLRTWRGLLEF